METVVRSTDIAGQQRIIAETGANWAQGFAYPPLPESLHRFLLLHLVQPLQMRPLIL